MTIATWRVPGLFKADPQKVYEEIREIGEEFSPEEIVERARDGATELHKCFDWDNDVAADKWRIHQARMITSHLVFRKEDSDDRDMPQVRILNKTDNGGYKIPERVFKVQSEYELLLQRAMAELRAFKVKYSALHELDYILQLID